MATTEWGAAFREAKSKIRTRDLDPTRSPVRGAFGSHPGPLALTRRGAAFLGTRPEGADKEPDPRPKPRALGGRRKGGRRFARPKRPNPDPGVDPEGGGISVQLLRS